MLTREELAKERAAWPELGKVIDMALALLDLADLMPGADVEQLGNALTRLHCYDEGSDWPAGARERVAELEAELATAREASLTNHCPTCICGKRAPMQATREPGVADWDSRLKTKISWSAHAAGTIAWSEHLLAWAEYARLYGTSQSAERMAQRGGFSWGELCAFLGREPTTWEPR